MLRAKRQSAYGLKEEIVEETVGTRERERGLHGEESEGRHRRGIGAREETGRKGRASSTASSSALRRHLNHVEGERERCRDRYRSRRKTRERENRVRDVTAKERRRGQGGVKGR